MRGNDAADPPRRQGVTLVEMFVVGFILLILVAVLLPAVQKTREASRRATCQNNLRQIGLAFRLYGQAHHTWPGPGPRDRLGGWAIDILPYVEQQPLADQLAASTSLAPSLASPSAHQRPAVLTCPSARDGESRIPQVPIAVYASSVGSAADLPGGTMAWIESPAVPPNLRTSRGPHDGGFNELSNAESVRWVPGGSR